MEERQMLQRRLLKEKGYLEQSIKKAERARRGKQIQGGPQVIKIVSGKQKIPVQWKKFLSCGKNKDQIAEFFFTSWADTEIRDHMTVVLAHGEECHAITFGDGLTKAEPVPELYCSHEEADTRLLLHSAQAAKTAPTVVIQSPDTDVIVIAVSVCDQISARLLFETGTGNQRRTLDVNTIANHLGNPLASALLGLHNFTGCDTVSSFFGIAKKKPTALLLTEKGRKFVNVFQCIGKDFALDNTLIPLTEEFVSVMYGESGQEVNSTRSALFKGGKCMEDMLPPNADSLKFHLKRANYQTAIQRRCLEQFSEVPSPHGHGWVCKDGILTIKWMELPCAPDAVLELVHCNCKKSNCQKRTCSCFKNSLNCTDLCNCLHCENCEAVDLQPTTSDMQNDSSDEDTASED